MSERDFGYDFDIFQNSPFNIDLDLIIFGLERELLSQNCLKNYLLLELEQGIKFNEEKMNLLIDLLDNYYYTKIELLNKIQRFYQISNLENIELIQDKIKFATLLHIKNNYKNSLVMSGDLNTIYWALDEPEDLKDFFCYDYYMYMELENLTDEEIYNSLIKDLTNYLSNLAQKYNWKLN